MKIIVTGSKGQLGSDVVSKLELCGHQVIGVDLPETDITVENSIKTFIIKNKPDAVIHLAAYTAVDKAEQEDRELCNKVNAEGTRYISEVCCNLGIKLLFTSTDYVFNSMHNHNIEVDEITDPINWYGKTKEIGESCVRKNCPKHFIVRISWVFGKNGKNFAKTMLHLSEINDELNVIADQIGSPTYTIDLAELISNMIISDKYGTYHATNEGFCSWAEYAEKIFEFSGRNTRVNFICSDEYKTAAIRPKNSRLSKDMLDVNGFKRLPVWEDALKRFLNEI